MKTRDVVGGAVLMAVSAVLFTQLTGVEEVVFEDDIDPMQYPRYLVVLLALMGALLAGRGLTLREEAGDIPIFSRRTFGIMAVLLAYAVIFTSAGFVISSFLAGSAVALIMGWRRLPLLVALYALAVAAIWVLFIHILRIPLPMGALF